MTTNARPAPVPDPESQPYWDAAARHALELPYCDACARYVFPPPSRLHALPERKRAAAMDRSQRSRHGAQLRRYA